METIVETALLALWREIARSSQQRVAARLGVSSGTITRWRQGVRPAGKSVELLLAWASALPATAAPGPIPTAVIVHARQQVAETHRDLARIYGYAESIAGLAESVAQRQRTLLTMLMPWVVSETDVVAGKVAGVLEALAALDASEAATPTAAAPSQPAGRGPTQKSAR